MRPRRAVVVRNAIGKVIAMKMAKRQIYADLLTHDVGGALEGSKALIGELMKLPDYAEGIAAMKEKRPPKFQDL